DIGSDEIFESIVETVPAPEGDPSAPLKAFIFDSEYAQYRGATSALRGIDRTVPVGARIRMMQTTATLEVTEVGIHRHATLAVDELTVGDVGFIAAQVKSVSDARVGDTITHADNPTDTPLPGYKRMNPMVYCGLYPIDSGDYVDLREALERLQLN